MPQENDVEYFLNQVIENLKGATKEQLIVWNQWAAVALNRFHENSEVIFNFKIDDREISCKLKWDSNFDQNAMREQRNIAENGGISLAMFVMSVLKDYRYVHQTEIGEGVDYGFQKDQPQTDNFLADCHYVEVSGLLSETSSNTILNRVKIKHGQIEKGYRKDSQSSVIVSLFDQPLTVKEIHN